MALSDCRLDRVAKALRNLIISLIAHHAFIVRRKAGYTRLGARGGGTSSLKPTNNCGALRPRGEIENISHTRRALHAEASGPSAYLFSALSGLSSAAFFPLRNAVWTFPESLRRATSLQSSSAESSAWCAGASAPDLRRPTLNPSSLRRSILTPLPSSLGARLVRECVLRSCCHHRAP